MKWWEVEKLIFTLGRERDGEEDILMWLLKIALNSTDKKGKRQFQNPTVLFDFSP